MLEFHGLGIFHFGISQTWDFSFFNVMDRTHPETEHIPKRDFHFSISRNDYVNRTAPEAPLQFRYNSALDKW